MARPSVDIKLAHEFESIVTYEKHCKFLVSLEKKKDCTLDYLRMSGVYWSLTALDLLGFLNEIDKSKIIGFVLSCQKPDGGLSPSPCHDSHILSTLSGLQIMALYDSLDLLNLEAIKKFIVSLQKPEGSFVGDKWGEIDTRFAFCAIASLCLTGHLKPGHPPPAKAKRGSETSVGSRVPGVDLDKTANYLVRCQNLDGGFSTRPGSESHAGQAYCVIGAMALLGQLRRLDTERAAWWLAERQLPSGGLNGRPEKQPDVCYSWWVLSSLTMLGRLVWISDIDLARFIMASQDAELGGIADRPGNLPDPFHTLFGLAGLSLLARKGTAAASFSDRLTVDGHSDTQIADSCTVEALADQISKETEKVDKLDSKYQIGTAKGDSVREPAESTSQIDNLESVAENKLQAVSNVPQSIMETSLCLAMCGKRLRPINPVYCLPQHVVDRLAIDVPLLR